jgi:SAM-dependent methyltransferase
VAADTRLPFKSNSFDGAICYDIFEHLNNPREILRELKRCVKGRLVVSVPNCADSNALIESGLTYEHFMELDHRNFFDRISLFELFSEFYEHVDIHEIMPVEHFLYRPSDNLAGVLVYKILKAQLKAIRKLGFIKRRFYNHLVAICETNEK